MPIEHDYTLPTNSNEKTARAIALLRTRLSNFETEHGRRSGLSYQPLEPDEALITTSPKAGTTWLQQICHQMRVAFQFRRGDDQFDEISQVVPWLELAMDQGQDLYAPQYMGGGGGDGGSPKGNYNLQPPSLPNQPPPSLKPRLFKTHAWQGHCPTGFHKVIVGIRDPVDVVISFYYFFQGWFFPSNPDDEGFVTLDDFVRHFWLARGTPTSKMENASYFVHLVSWYRAYLEELQRLRLKGVDDKQKQQQHDILFVFYEDLKDDLEGQVRRIASFLSTHEYNFVRDDIIQLVVEQSSFTYMKQHERLFDEKLSKLARNEACGLPRDAGLRASKLRLGRSSSSSIDVYAATETPPLDPLHPWRRHQLQDEVSLDLQDEIQEQWTKVVTPVTGCATYADLRRHLRMLDGVDTTVTTTKAGNKHKLTCC